jgi:hypothetical protein
VQSSLRLSELTYRITPGKLPRIRDKRLARNTGQLAAQLDIPWCPAVKIRASNSSLGKHARPTSRMLCDEEPPQFFGARVICWHEASFVAKTVAFCEIVVAEQR